MALRTLSLCSGIGGLDLGIRRAVPAARTICYVEREAFCVEVLATRMEEQALDDAPVWSDLKTFDGKPWRGLVDLVTGGYPCQPFSLAGSRKGADDPRHLWPDVRRIVEEVAPPLCFFENVAGHLSLGFEDVVRDLEALGYSVAAGLFTAEEVGAPHRRERLFILAHHDRKLCGQGSAKRDRSEEGSQPNERTGPVRDGRELANSESLRCRTASGLADADERRREGVGRSGLLDGVWPARGDDADGRSGSSIELVDTESQRALPAQLCGQRREPQPSVEELGDPRSPRLEVGRPVTVTRAFAAAGETGSSSGERECEDGRTGSVGSAALPELRRSINEEEDGARRSAEPAGTEREQSGSERSDSKFSGDTAGSADAAGRWRKPSSASTTSTAEDTSTGRRSGTSAPGSGAEDSRRDTESSARTAMHQSEDREDARTRGRSLRDVWPLPWPPGPQGDWSGVSEEAQPAVRRVANESSDRVDRLRALGNGVVPAQAALAFRTLAGVLLA